MYTIWINFINYVHNKGAINLLTEKLNEVHSEKPPQE